MKKTWSTETDVAGNSWEGPRAVWPWSGICYEACPELLIVARARGKGNDDDRPTMMMSAIVQRPNEIVSTNANTHFLLWCQLLQLLSIEVEDELCHVRHVTHHQRLSARLLIGLFTTSHTSITSALYSGFKTGPTYSGGFKGWWGQSPLLAHIF